MTKEVKVSGKKERGSWAAVAIRGMWSFLLPGVSWGVIFALDNLTGIGIPMWACIPAGAVLYATKKRFFPNTLL